MRIRKKNELQKVLSQAADQVEVSKVKATQLNKMDSSPLPVNRPASTLSRNPNQLQVKPPNKLMHHNKASSPHRRVLASQALTAARKTMPSNQKSQKRTSKLPKTAINRFQMTASAKSEMKVFHKTQWSFC